MSVIFGSARSDSRGQYSGDTAGDSKQTTTPDYSGEVSMQEGYVHSKGWRVLRLKDDAQAVKIAKAMETACNNSNIGYDQGNRDDILKYGTSTAVKTECDCSSLVRQCFIEATGTDPGDFYTGTEVAKLLATGLVTEVEFTSVSALYTGDILVTKTKGHTVIVVSGLSRGSTETYPKWIKSGSKWYYRTAANTNAHGWQKVKCANEKTYWFYFGSDGTMWTGWQTIDGKLYYMSESGDLEGALYRTDSSGAQSIWEIE